MSTILDRLGIFSTQKTLPVVACTLPYLQHHTHPSFRPALSFSHIALITPFISLRRRVHLLMRLLRRLPAIRNPLQDSLPVLVELELSDHNLGRRNAQLDGGSVRFLPCHALDVDHVFQAVDGCDFAFAAFVGAACDHDFVVFSDGD